MCNRQHDGGSVVHRERNLHESLAETVLAHNQRAVVILQSTRDNLRGRSCAAIDEDDERRLVRRVVVGDDRIGATANAPLLRQNQLAVAEECPRHADGLLDQPAAVAAQIQNQHLHVLAAQALQSRAKLVARREIKAAGQGYVTDTRLNHVGFGNRRLRDGIARYLDRLRPRVCRVLDQHLDGCPQRPAQALAHLVKGLAAHVLAVDFKDAVAVEQARAARRRVREGRANVRVHFVVQAQVYDRSADAEILRALVCPKLVKLRLVEKA